MIPAPRESALQLNARLLDRAIHDTFRRLWPLALPFVLVDALGAVYDGPLPGNILVGLIFSGLIENRSRAVGARSLSRYDGKRLAWSALLHPASLWFALIGALDFVVVPLVLVVAVLPMSFWNLVHSGVRSPVAMVAVGLLALILEFVVLAVLAGTLLMLLAGASAMLDVVVDDAPAGRTFGRWMRRTFRRRTIGSSLVAATIYIALFIGVTAVFAGLAQQPRWLHALVISVPDGIADTIGFMFVWQWRNAVLDRELGRDISADLDARAVPAVPTA